ncbi:3-hydroxyisobutyryl-CoA hydrolase [Rhodovulum sp. FJ3]|uniref:3-hydroxyisobutyryl-CoA hydrolase n=1 Tax=Rhodovulum sp. FJ3 TaxID=3079053 RepID=UPI00293DC5E1|nr:3-hydroxyisobutyryl-CoA hydrolase [Rhodovulum sp. FJ3]MDV4167870.1 3-hydroxyisobutyryl-CoA hydrolase [Rhodovulum sp. FJ3]
MSDDLSTEKQGRVGRITFTRPQALNALSHEMAMKIEQALDAWATDDDVAMIVIDAEGERAFCAGGDIAAMYHAGKAGDYQIARDFWADEYRMNAKMFNFPKPVAAFMQGFVMGGGVGVGGHASHRIVGDTSQVAMPESGIGLIPDVGGTLLLARAPGRIGEYLGVTGARMGPGDAIHAGFADYYIPEDDWPDLIAQLVDTGDWTLIDAAARPAPDAPLADLQPQIDAHFGGETIGDIVRSLRHEDTDFTAAALKPINRNSPLSMACTVELIHRTRIRDTIEAALANEYRFTYRALELGDFIEGVRAQIIDKDRNPTWQDADAETLPATKISRMLMPLGADELTL